MLENAFVGKKTRPSPKELATELGPSNELWQLLIAEITEQCGITEQEWNSPSPKYGWSLRLKRKKRNILYLGPCHRSFRVALVLGDKAMKAAHTLQVAPAIAKIIKEAPHYPEGSAIRFEIRSAADLDAVKQLARVKVEN